jgi:uncharacterized phiE125 gp8 family phage protein
MTDWTTLARVKRHLNLDADNTDLDDKINDLIPAASLALEHHIGHPLHEATYTEYYDGDRTNEIILDHYPVSAITSINDDLTRVFDAASLLLPANYVYDANGQRNIGSVRLFQGTATFFQRGIQNVKVVYVAGYATLPEDAEMAAVHLVAWLLSRSGSEGMSAATLGAKSESYEPDSIPPYIKRMVAAYKKYAV